MYSEISLMKKMNYAQLVGLCGIRLIMWKRPNYAQNYARALHSRRRIIPPSAMIKHYTNARYFTLLCFRDVHLSSNGSVAAETLSEEDDDIALGGHDGISASAMPELVSDFVPSPGGPFSALTPSMWPQDILHRLSNPVRSQALNSTFISFSSALL